MIDYDPAEDDPRAKTLQCIGRTANGERCQRSVRFAVTGDPAPEWVEGDTKNFGPYCDDHRDQKPKATPEHGGPA